MKASALFLLLCGSAGISACIKGKNAEPVVLTPRQQLAGNWQLRDYTADSVFSNTDTLRTDAYARLAPCRQDDVFQFGTDGILLLQQGSDNCDPAGGASLALGYWKLLEKPSRLIMDDPDLPGSTDTLLVEALTETSFRVANQSAFSTPAGVMVQVQLRKTYTLKK